MIKELNELYDAREALMKVSELGIIPDVGAELSNMKRKEFELKENKVLEVHPYAISEVEIIKRGKPKRVYQTRTEEHGRPRCSTYEALIEKLFTIYFGNDIMTNYSFASVFEKALQHKEETERPKEKTIRVYNEVYRNLITSELKKKDIRKITTSDLRKFMMDITADKQLKIKRFQNLRTALNLVFKYAADGEQGYIVRNPMPSNSTAIFKQCAPTVACPEAKAFQPDDIEKIKTYLWDKIDTRPYCPSFFAILFAIETGVREGEIPSLKWSDISDNRIHIHSQQLDEKRDGKKVYYYVPYTKNEQLKPKGGRYFPVTKAIRNILDALREKQLALGIKSEYVFAKRDGCWIKTKSYERRLHSVTTTLGLSLTNNHALRMSLNSYVFIPMGLAVTERARLLGHSVETNLRNYSFALADDYVNQIGKIMDDYAAKQTEHERGTSGYPNALPFSVIEKSPQVANLQTFFKLV